MESISIGIVPRYAMREKLLAKVYAKNEGKVYHGEASFENEEQVMHIGFNPLELEVYLLSSEDGELLDQRWFNPYTIASQIPMQNLTRNLFGV